MVILIGKSEQLRRLTFIGSALLMSSFTLTAMALNTGQIVTNPRILEEQPVRTESLKDFTLMGLPRVKSADFHERILDLKVVYTDAQLFNPATARYDKVRLRSYNGTDVSPETPYVAPSIEIKPGETVRVNLDNQLPADSKCAGSVHDMNEPHCFNGTNLHTHGLWVNPAGNGDNVLLSINPGVKFEYEYNVPSDHPAGTFWYHTHRHGSTALQVSSGMAGALIIRGDRLPTETGNGDIDTLLTPFLERTLVMQQIQYACRTKPTAQDPNGKIKQDANGRYICDPGDVGVIEDYDQFGPGTWPASGRYTSINGLVLPTFEAVQGKIERWRMIHAGVRDTISVQFFKVRSNKSAAAYDKIKSATEEKNLITNNCSTEPLPYTLIAADGLTMGAGHQVDLATWQPGYRYDALVVFPEAGEYCVVDASGPESATVNGLEVGGRLLGFVNASTGTAVTDIKSYVTEVLLDQADRVMPDGIKAQVMSDLHDGMKFTHFIPHADVAASEVTGKQELTFNIDVTNPSQGVKFEVGNTLNTDDAQPYDPNRIDRKLVLGTVDEWVMQSHFVSHPFHIHVNPFQVVEILDPNGKDVSALDSVDDYGGSIDPQYAGLKDVWKDTLWIKSVKQGKDYVPYTIKVRTRYQRYIGEFVLHCHILDHEDQGMMQNVAVVLPGSLTSESNPTGHD
ncbi:multicopper oxidase family protein [Neptunomonas sp.]|uniref:multicopper oxidase family protein n=1 Tax=Neptunomonas sp. TaxID=1971898 RepID=UPI003569AFA5